MRGRRTVVLVAAATFVVALVGALAVPAAQAQTGWTLLGSYQLDEAPGSTRLVDSSGRGIHGSIGRDVQLGLRSGSSTYHKFPYVSSKSPSNPARTHLITTNNAALNPGTANFAVEVRLRTSVNDGNVTQKGQSGGGPYWKLELHNGGYAHCVFKGTNATVSLDSYSKVTNGQWHTIRCERRTDRAIMYVDGVQHANRRVATGSLNTSWEQVIGGKSRCTSAGVQCDYYRGDLDYVRFERS